MVVLSLSAMTLSAWPRSLIMAVSSLRPSSSVMTVPPVRTAMSCSMALRRSPKPGALTARQLNMPRSLFSTRVASASPSTSSAMMTTSRLPSWTSFSRIGHDVGGGRDLLVGDQDVRVVELGFHRLGVGDEVGADVAAVELHTLDVLGLELQALGLFDGDDAVLADLLHDLGDQVADLRVLGRDGGHGGDLFLGGDGDGLRLDRWRPGRRRPSRCRA